MEKIRVALTGASGFIGSALLSKLKTHYSTVVLGRSSDNIASDTNFSYYDLACPTDISAALSSVDVVIHCAAIAEVSSKSTPSYLEYFHRINTDSVISLARSAAIGGVKRFIFVSSLKAMGESTTGREPFSIEDELSPQDAYGISKAKAENALFELSRETGIEVVIIRPPMVYGKGGKGNFSSLQRLVSKNLPLPLGQINNKRSLIALDNLIDFIFLCVAHPSAANQAFLVSDGQDVSTTELVSMMIQAAGKHPRLLPFPEALFKLACRLTGRQSLAERLCGSLSVDITYTKKQLNWNPPISVEEGIRRCF